MPNEENINKIIAVLKKDREVGTHFRMGAFYGYINLAKVPVEELRTYQECNTALCIAGWANLLRMKEENPKYLEDASFFSCNIDSTFYARHWLGISEDQGTSLFYMHNSEGCSLDLLGIFDDEEFASTEQRYTAGIRVLEILRDENVVDWVRAMKEAGIKLNDG